MKALDTVARGIGMFALLLTLWSYAMVAIVSISIVFFFAAILRKT